MNDALSVKGALRQPALSNKAAIAIGREADADIAIVGKVLVTDGGQIMKDVDMHSFNAVGTLRVLNVDTAEIIAVADQTATAAHVDGSLGGREAIRALAKKIGSDLERRIVDQWTAEAAGARRLELVVEGIRSTRMLRALARAIREEIRGVESVRVRRRRQKKAYLSVQVRASATDFSRDLESKQFKDFSLETVSLSRTKLVAQVKR